MLLPTSVAEAAGPAAAWLIGVVTGGGVFAWLWRRRYRRLLRAVRQLQDGDFTTAMADLGAGPIDADLERLRATLEDCDRRAQVDRRCSAALEATSAALMITDTDFNILHVNPAIVEMLRNRTDALEATLGEFDPDDLVGRNMDIFHRRPEMIRALLSNPERLPFQSDIPLGEVRLNVTVSAVRDASGAHAAMVVEWQDVTDERRTSAILDAIETGQVVAEFTTDGHLRTCNPGFETPWAACSGQSEGLFSDHLHAVADDLSDAEILEELRGGRPVPGPFRLEDREGGMQAYFEGGLFPIRMKNGKTIGAILIGNDVTVARRTLADAEAERARLTREQADVVGWSAPPFRRQHASPAGG
ncbi:MAG: PAS domain-containing protein [Pseudooceanicola sp.]